MLFLPSVWFKRGNSVGKEKDEMCENLKRLTLRSLSLVNFLLLPIFELTCCALDLYHPLKAVITIEAVSLFPYAPSILSPWSVTCVTSFSCKFLFLIPRRLWTWFVCRKLCFGICIPDTACCLISGACASTSYFSDVHRRRHCSFAANNIREYAIAKWSRKRPCKFEVGKSLVFCHRSGREAVSLQLYSCSGKEQTSVKIPFVDAWRW